ncbi:hypothetical protein ABTY00_34330 [Streptomyces microflavus]|uniref:hypothetical protein n=1 Tax=Streptomyces microflavus TaxID=1919 RepID=UPI00332A0004
MALTDRHVLPSLLAAAALHGWFAGQQATRAATLARMDPWLSVIPAASGLLGAVIGITSTLLTERWRARTTLQQEQRLVASRLRDERKEAILNFLASCQQVEHAAEQRSQIGNHFVEGSPSLTHEMWFRQKSLDLVAGARVRGTAYTLANCLMETVYGQHRTVGEVQDFIHKQRGPFLDAAKEALGIPENPELSGH